MNAEERAARDLQRQVELAELRGEAAARLRKLPAAYFDWGVVRSRAYVLALERLTRAAASRDKRPERVISRMRKHLASLESAMVTPSIAECAEYIHDEENRA